MLKIPSSSASAVIASIITVLSGLSAASVPTYAANDTIRYEAEFRGTLSTGENTPFWLVNNLHGLGWPEKNNCFVRGALFKETDKSRRFSWGAGADLVAGTPAFLIRQLYGEVRYRSLGAVFGSKIMEGEFVNPRLSSGDLLYSGNALPVPQLRVGIFDYAPVWGTKGWLSAKGYMAYGMFTDSHWQKSWAAPGSKRTDDVLYHSKGLWLQGGDSKRFPLVAEIGIEMATQFGGKSYQDGKVIKAGHSLKDWWKAFFPHSSEQTNHDGTVKSVEGNMLGTYDFSLSWIPDADWSVRAYYQHYFEDQSQMTFEYGWKDGLWGLQVQLPENPAVAEVVYEFLYSKDQSGAVLSNSGPDMPEQVSGRDNYYNHSVYTGWQHRGMGIGNPLMLSPIYNSNRHLTFLDTRIIAHHVGIAGKPHPALSYRMLLSFSRNWGTYNHPLPEVLGNFNGLLEVEWTPERFRGWQAKIGMAADGGQLLGKSFGVMLSIQKTGWFGF